MQFRTVAMLCLGLLCSFEPVNAEYIEEVPKDFIGFLDVHTRYDFPSEWTEADWKSVTEGRSFVVSRSEPISTDDVTRTTMKVTWQSFLTLEIADHRQAVIVYRKKEDWVEVRVDGDPLWIEMHDGDRYIPYEKLFDYDKLAYLLSPTIMLSDQPERRARPLKVQPSMRGGAFDNNFTYGPDIVKFGRVAIYHYDALGTGEADLSANYEKRDWFHIRIPSAPHCSGDTKATDSPIIEGWIPSRTVSNEVSIWFNARGC